MTKYEPRNRATHSEAPHERSRQQRYYEGYPQHRAPQKPVQKKKKHTALIVILIIVVLLLAAAVVGGIKAKAEINTLKEQAYELKDNLKVTLDCVKGMDPDGAEDAYNKVEETSGEIQETLDSTFWKIASKIPVYGEDVGTVKRLVTTLDEAGDNVIHPFIDLIREHPLSELKETENGLNVSIIISYLDFLDETAPDLHSISEQLSDVKFNTIDMDITEYADKFTSLFEALDKAGEYKDLLRAFIGDGSNKLYLVMAQNSAEIRAAGGFPGSVGTISIQDGILSIGDFSSIVNYVYQANTPEANITDREAELFRSMYVNWAHDACYNPHFAKMAYITKVGYEQRHGESIDGILSMTPVIIQQLLELTGEEIYLDDGTVLDGENATRVLQRDLYLKYQNDDATAYSNNDYIDPLFAETAKQAIGLLFRGFDVDNLSGYMDFLVNCCKNRTMMLWFADEEEEAISVETGCSGNLNSDPEDPAAGVYFSCCDAGKLGMFVEIDTEVSEPVTNDNNEQEYTVTVTLNNYLDEYAADGYSSTWILGSHLGDIQSYVYFFAPAGGTVSDFESSNGVEVTMSDYEDLEVGYVIDLYLSPGSPVTFTYKVTTAEGVTTPLRIESTPTLQDYR